jgi:hypothetical protein
MLNDDENCYPDKKKYFFLKKNQNFYKNTRRNASAAKVSDLQSKNSCHLVTQKNSLVHHRKYAGKQQFQ